MLGWPVTGVSLQEWALGAMPATGVEPARGSSSTLGTGLGELSVRTVRCDYSGRGLSKPLHPSSLPSAKELVGRPRCHSQSQPVDMWTMRLRRTAGEHGQRCALPTFARLAHIPTGSTSIF